MKVEVLPIGLYGENSYVLHDNGHVLFVDPGRHAREIAKCVDDKETVDGILLTHGHEDHTGAADDLADMFDCKIYMDLKDHILVDPKNSGRYGYDAPIYHEISDLKEEMTIGAFRIRVYETPGHTAGSVCIQYRNILFTGDTLFAADIGRTDLYSGSEEEMFASLLKLKQLPHDLHVLPGHGPATTIGDEIKRNPYMIRLG